MRVAVLTREPGVFVLPATLRSEMVALVQLLSTARAAP